MSAFTEVTLVLVVVAAACAIPGAFLVLLFGAERLQPKAIPVRVRRR